MQIQISWGRLDSHADADIIYAVEYHKIITEHMRNCK
jgi:hypothetical protein